MMLRALTESPVPGKIEYASARSRGDTTPVPSDKDGTSGKSLNPAVVARRITARDPTDCCRSAAAALFDSRSAARSVISSGWSPCEAPGFHSGLSGAVTLLRFFSTDTGEYPRSRAAAKTNGLNADPG